MKNKLPVKILAILLSCGLLTVSFLIMFIHDEEQKFGE